MPKDAQIYAQIKRFGDLKYDIQTICATRADSIQSCIRGYFSNLALKFNMKLGGQNHSVRAAELGIIKDGKTMLVGFDVTHPSPGSNSLAPSIAAMVASVDSKLAQWPATIRVQEGRQERVDVLRDMLKRHLGLWKAKNGELPKNILVYRDGVSEGQYHMVATYELPELREACKQLYGPDSQQPSFSIIVVGKQIHTRFFPTDASQADKGGNCKSGTVVDRGVTDARQWDLFLQSHACIQGTVRPTHYFVLHDDIFRDYYKKAELPPGRKTSHDALEFLTHSLCFTYGCATKGISICPPARYADMACDRARLYLKSLYEDSAGADVGLTKGTDDASKKKRIAQLQARINFGPNLMDEMFYI
jgi:eukaryotic translation initiation factor 2C